MELNKALSQLDEIHGHLARTEMYRGYRSIPVALTGIIALAAGLLQPKIMPGAFTTDFAMYWAGVAFVSLLLVGSEIAFNYYARASALARRGTRKVVGQFLPSVVAGLMATAVLALLGNNHIVLLPGIWAVLFSMGIFASRPYLPHAVGWVALFYLGAGGILLWLGQIEPHWLSLGMGVTFCVGQILAAVVLYWNLERKDYA